MPQHFDCRPEILFCTFALECSNERSLGPRVERKLYKYLSSWVIDEVLPEQETKAAVAKNLLGKVLTTLLSQWPRQRIVGTKTITKQTKGPGKMVSRVKLRFLDDLSHRILQLRIFTIKLPENLKLWFHCQVRFFTGFWDSLLSWRMSHMILFKWILWNFRKFYIKKKTSSLCYTREQKTKRFLLLSISVSISRE